MKYCNTVDIKGHVYPVFRNSRNAMVAAMGDEGGGERISLPLFTSRGKLRAFMSASGGPRYDVMEVGRDISEILFLAEVRWLNAVIMLDCSFGGGMVSGKPLGYAVEDNPDGEGGRHG